MEEKSPLEIGSSKIISEESTLVTESINDIQNIIAKEHKNDLPQDMYDVIANAIDDAFIYKKDLINYRLPILRQWIGPRNLYVWILPIIAILKVRNFLYSFYLYLCE